ncbi:MAG: hypothetical protein NTV22_11680 [bacterium]|nr:hypothetical protein [bacterium]
MNDIKIATLNFSVASVGAAARDHHLGIIIDDQFASALKVAGDGQRFACAWALTTAPDRDILGIVVNVGGADGEIAGDRV